MKFLNRERALLRTRRVKMSLRDFHTISKVGEGGYGEVFLCRKKDTNELCAVKKINKKILMLKNNVEQIKMEKDVMAASNSPWLVKLLYSFQDEKFLYLAMVRCLLCDRRLLT